MKTKVSLVLAVAVGVGVSISQIGSTALAATSSYESTVIRINGNTASTPKHLVAIDPSSKNYTSWLPLYYVEQVLNQIGIHASWNGVGGSLNLTVSRPLTGNIPSVQTITDKNMAFIVNGTTVEYAPRMIANDPSSGKPTTYVPVYYLSSVLRRIGITSTWNGTTWGLTNSSSTSSGSSSSASENVVVGTANGVREWDGTQWRQLIGNNSIVPTGRVNSIISLPNGDIVAGNAGVYMWNGTNWTLLGGSIELETGDANSASVLTLNALPNGDIVAGTAGGVFEWNSEVWKRLGNPSVFGGEGFGTVRSDGTIVAAIDSSIYQWNGTRWTRLGDSVLNSGIDGNAYFVTSISTLSNGNIIAGTSQKGVFEWNGSAWTQLGGASNPFTHGLGVTSLGALLNGDIVAGTIGGGVMEWDGKTWTRLGTPYLDGRTAPPAQGTDLSNEVTCISVRSNGDVLAGVSLGGAFEWNGSTWTRLGPQLNVIDASNLKSSIVFSISSVQSQ